MMKGPGKLFFLASFLYLGVGTILGFLMAYLRGKWILRIVPVHAHVNLFGWVSMLIFGFAYSYLPILAGKTLYSTTLPYIHFILANIGLIGMGCMWFGSRFPKSPIPPGWVWPFGGLVVLSTWLFIFNMVMTLLG